MELHVSKRLSGILPPLTKEEREGLESNLLADGKKFSPIIYWNDGEQNVIVDGMHSWEIIQRHDLPYTTEELTFGNYEDAELWILDHALNQRNLTNPQVLRQIRGTLYNRIKARHGGNRKNGSSAQNEHLIGATAEHLGEKYGVSGSTIRRDGEFSELVDQLEHALAKQIKAGKKITEAELKVAVELPAATQVAMAHDLRVGQLSTVAEAFEKYEVKLPRKKTSTVKTDDPIEASVSDDSESVVEEDLTPEQQADKESKEIESVCRKVQDQAGEAPHFYWCEEGGRRDSFISQVKNACGTLRTAKCIECPTCGGKGCKACHEKGYLPKQYARS